MRKDAPGPAPGFSLVELLATMAVAAILLGVAMPAFREALLRQRVAAAQLLLVTQLAQARNTAVASRVPVTVCPSLGDGRCRLEPDWSAGWLAYRDPRRSDQPLAPGDILRQEQRSPGALRILASAGRLRIRYQPDGRSGGSNITLRICAGSGLRGEVVVNNVGRARSQRSATGAACDTVP